MGKPAESAKALLKVAKEESSLLHALTAEVRSEVVLGEVDPEMVLPLCKEIQARAQAVYNRVEQATRGEQADG